MTDRSKALLVMDKKHLENRMHTIILDAGPIIKGQPPVSTLLQQCEQLVSSPSVVSEIRDQETRTRLETTVLPFLQLRTPKPDSIKFVSDFARKTGDLAVLSSTDIRLLALAYDVECERNGGDWRLRRTPGQKRTNGPPPANLNLNQEGKSTEDVPEMKSEDVNAVQSGQDPIEQPAVAKTTPNVIELPDEDSNIADCVSKEATGEDYNSSVSNQDEQLAKQLEAVRLSAEEITQAEETSEDSDSDDWITPSNLKRKQNEDTNGDSSGASEPKIMQVAMITTDFAMQNVLLQMNLNLLSPSLQRVKHVKTFILRCHACFLQVRDLSKQFCPRCGNATLTRVTCSTNQNGEFKIHLKKTMQWSNRGNRYSVPKAVQGAANHRVKGGGKGGWGNDLILSEDQKEYVRALSEEKRHKKKDLMDPDSLPSILSGDRSKALERPKVGAGRNVNSKKR